MKLRWPAAHFLLCSPVPNRPRTRDWGPLLYPVLSLLALPPLLLLLILLLLFVLVVVLYLGLVCLLFLKFFFIVVKYV